MNETKDINEMDLKELREEIRNVKMEMDNRTRNHYSEMNDEQIKFDILWQEKETLSITLKTILKTLNT